MKISILLLAVPALAESAIRAPVQTDHGCFRNSYPACKTAFACTTGFSLHCQQFHYSEGCDGWWRRGAYGEALDCCQCRSPGSPPILVTPTLQSAECWENSEKCPTSTSQGLPGQQVPSCCGRKGDCPQGFVLAEPLTVCGRRDCDLSELQSYTWTEVTNASRSCWTRDQRGWYYKPEAVTCQTCVYVGDTTTASSTFTATSTTTLTVTVPAAAVWEPVGAPGESACRGRNVNDNLGVYYTVHGSKSIEECKDLCLQHYPRCKGIEYSNNRCEIWTRPQGIYVSKPLSGFTCLRFGWGTKKLFPVDGGSGRACRGASPTDNSEAYYSVSRATVLKDCKAQCSAAAICFGIEFSLGRCEIWRRPVEAAAQRPGFTCLAFWSESILP